jgi:putative transposase
MSSLATFFMPNNSLSVDYLNPDNTKNMQIQEIEIPPQGGEVHLKAYDFIKVFKTVSNNADIGYRATDVLEMNEAKREK